MYARRLLRRALLATTTGALVVSTAWAGTGLVPVPTAETASDLGTDAAATAGAADSNPVALEDGLDLPGEVTVGGALPPGFALVGAAKASIAPRPDDYDGTWETDPDACARMDDRLFTSFSEDPEGELGHLASTGSPWPENPDCIYMGGFGIGPANPITSFDEEYGLWVRSVAISDGTDELVLTIVDGEGYFWDYASKCDDCGVKQLSADLGAELGIDPSGIIIAATHAHSSPDFIGGWGFVPDWYMTQVTETIRATIAEAVATMEPARLEVGEVLARGQNHERRDTYRAAEEQQLTWLRAYQPGGQGQASDRTIATIGAYAAHPTTKGTNDGVAHADWPGLFEKAVEDRFGGIGLHFMTGLGNMSSSGGTVIGEQLAALIPDVGRGTALTDTDVRTARETWVQPATNVPLTSLGAAGFFDRTFNPGPATIQTGEEPETAPCSSASAYSVEVAAGAARIGDQFALTTAPGEIFSNYSNTLKEKSGALVTMPLGQANDALGYMPQDFEMSPIGQQGLGFVAGGYLIVNYEDSYAIDRCFGDAALETSIRLLDQLRAS